MSYKRIVPIQNNIHTSPPLPPEIDAISIVVGVRPIKRRINLFNNKNKDTIKRVKKERK